VRRIFGVQMAVAIAIAAVTVWVAIRLGPLLFDHDGVVAKLEQSRSELAALETRLANVQQSNGLLADALRAYHTANYKLAAATLDEAAKMDPENRELAGLSALIATKQQPSSFLVSYDLSAISDPDCALFVYSGFNNSIECSPTTDIAWQFDQSVGISWRLGDRDDLFATNVPDLWYGQVDTLANIALGTRLSVGLNYTHIYDTQQASKIPE
jgi:hypothetical protein